MPIQELTETQKHNVNILSPRLRDLNLNGEITIEQYKKVLTKAYQTAWLISLEGIEDFIILNLNDN